MTAEAAANAAPNVPSPPVPDPADIHTRVFQDATSWETFLTRWTDPNLSIQEALGLLHGLLEKGTDNWPARIRFLFTLARRTFYPSSPWKTAEKHREALLDKARDTIARRFFQKANPERAGYDGFVIPEGPFAKDPSLIAHVLDFFLHGEDGNRVYEMERFVDPFVCMLVTCVNRYDRDDLDAIGKTLADDATTRDLLARVILTFGARHYGFFAPTRETISLLRTLAFEPNERGERPESLGAAMRWHSSFHAVNDAAAKHLPTLKALVEHDEGVAWKTSSDARKEQLDHLLAKRQAVDADAVSPKAIRALDEEISEATSALARIQANLPKPISIDRD